ncbi:hypothetical protein NE562_09225 [Butyricicoccus faecihominis]|nr:hypothetical protein [Butyricicoccus faecihominis]
MNVLTIATVGTAYQMACDIGIIRGGDDTAFGAKLNLVSMWCIVLPLSAMTAFYFQKPAFKAGFLLTKAVKSGIIYPFIRKVR